VQFVVLTPDQVLYLPLDKSEAATFAKMSAVISDRDGFRPKIIQGTDDEVGIVTVHDGPSLQPGEIIAGMAGNDAQNAATYHNNFQDADKFIAAGGQRGRQLQVLVEGTYYINRLFATIEMIRRRHRGRHVGVVVSVHGRKRPRYVGRRVSARRAGRNNRRGVWKDPLLPASTPSTPSPGSAFTCPTRTSS
jgi:uncharacterized membrane protein YqiK